MQFPLSVDAALTAVMIIKRFTDGAAVKHLKGFAVIQSIWSKKHKGVYANVLLWALFFGIYLFILPFKTKLAAARSWSVDLKIEGD